MIQLVMMINSLYWLCVQVPASPVAFVFPGQGSQAVGMMDSVKDVPAVKEMLASATKILGYDLLKICLEVMSGPMLVTHDMFLYVLLYIETFVEL